MISIVACCHGAKLCAHAARDFRSQHYHQTVGAQGQVKLAKVAKKSGTYDITHKKSAHPKQKFIRVETRRLAASFYASTRPTALTKWEKFPHKATCVSALFFFENPQKWLDAKVLTLGVWLLLRIFEKNTWTHVALRGNFSAHLYGLRTWPKSQKTQQVF